VSLVCKITEKVVMAKIENDDEIIRHTVIDALQSLAAPENVTLSICPEDYEFIEMVKDEFFDVIETLESISVRSDPSVKRGGCKVETLTASVAADPEEKLKAVFESVKNAGI